MERLQYISQGNTVSEQLHSIHRALEAGCKWVQLRFKGGSETQLLSLAKAIKPLCADFGAQFIINDHPNVAKEIDAHGVHLGLDDMAIAQARELIGKEKIIGGTANTLSDLQRRCTEECDYIGLGPFRYTSTKKNLSPLLGINGYKNMLGQVKATPPIIAIGGIQFSDIDPLLEVGVFGVAMSSAITHHPNPKTIIQQIHDKFQRHLENRR